MNSFPGIFFFSAHFSFLYFKILLCYTKIDYGLVCAGPAEGAEPALIDNFRGEQTKKGNYEVIKIG